MSCRPAGFSDDSGEDSDDFEIWTDNRRKNNNGNNHHARSVINKDVSKESIFYDALKNVEIEKISKMLDDGFGINQPLAGGWSPLMHACSIGSLPLITFLVLKKANVNFTKDLFSPLMALSKSNSTNENELVKCLDILLENGANIDAMDRNATTPLMIACEAGHTGLVRRLIEMKCDINIQDSEGWSALFHAVQKEREDIIKILVEEKARLDLIDRRRRSAFDLALIKGLEHIAKLVCSKSEKRRLLIDEKKEVSSDFKITRDVVEDLFSQLPNQNKGIMTGFSSDVGKLLFSMGLRHYKNLFESQKIQLNDFLLITNEHLKEVGVRFSAHRQKILFSLRKFHLHQWNKTSLGMKPTNVQMDVDDGVKLVCNAVKHFHVLNATINYVSKYQPVPPKPKVFDLCENSIHQLDLIMAEIGTIQKCSISIRNREKLEPVDLIIKAKKTDKSYIFVIGTVAFFSFIVWKFKAV